jgi:hypothetical protein
VTEELLKDLPTGLERLRTGLRGLDLLALDRQAGAAGTDFFLLAGR